jgi:predicted peroxiredoxin
MSKFDKVFAGVLLGLINPAVALCIFWWGSYLLGLNAAFWAPLGLVLGIITDIFFLRKLVSRFYSFSIYALIALYMAYSVGIFGFFMGVPVFNAVLGVAAGLYVGRKMKINNRTPEVFTKEIKKAGRFAAAVLFLICVASAYIAIADPYTGANLKGMLNLSFEVTPLMIWLLIVLGGSSLLLMQHFLLRISGRIAYEKIK